MEKITAEGEGMPSVLRGDIVEKLKIAIDSGVETRGRSDGGKQTAQIGLRVAHIRWVRCCAVQPISCCERIAGIGILLTT